VANILHPATINRLRSTCSPVTALVKSFQISHGVDLISFSCKLITILVFLLPKDATAQQSPLKLDFYLYLHQINFSISKQKNENLYVISSLEMSVFFIVWHYNTNFTLKLMIASMRVWDQRFISAIEKYIEKEQINIKKMSWEKWFKIHWNNNWDNSLMFSDARINIRFGVMTLNVARFSWK